MVSGQAPADDSVEYRLSARVQRLERVVATLVLALIAVLTWSWLRPEGARAVMKAERLEIVEPDGQPAFVLSNSERPTVGTIDGEVLVEGQAEERTLPHFIFFDGHGDEVGGMLFGNEESGDEFSATRHLSLDGYKQDQTVRLFHRQNSHGAASGLSVTDRPEDLSLPETFRALGLQIPHTRNEASAAISKIPEKARADSLRALFGVNRVFLGSNDRGVATLVLKDGTGQPRIELRVPAEGAAHIRVLDEAGNVIAEVPRRGD